MNNGPTNMFKQPVKVGDTVALTTTSYKYSRTRIAKVVKIVQGNEIKNYDYTTRTYIPTGKYKYRVFVRLYKVTSKWDSVTKTGGPKTLVPYVKEVFGISDSVPIEFDSLPYEIQEVLKDKI